jgi:hypothetical protein
MKSGNIGIKYLADIGVADIDVYDTQRKKIVSKTSPKLLMFFRSEDQAKGLPKVDSSGKVKVDSKYDQSFGFDMFDERLYGNNTDVYTYDKIERKKSDGTLLKDKYGKSIYEYKLDILEKKIEKIVSKLETFYDKETPLSTELKDSSTSYFIDYEYTLSRRNTKMVDTNYYIPNVLIKPGKEVKLYIKLFDIDRSSKLNVEVMFRSSSNIGIDSFTNKLICNKSEEIIEFKIKTKQSEPIDTKITITAYVTNITGDEIVIGKLNLLPNKLLQTKLFFIDVFYDLITGTNTFNGVNMINELNQKAINQASIEMVSGGANKTLFIKPTDRMLKDGVYTGTPISNNLSNKGTGKLYELNDLGIGLNIITSKFYENMVNEIFTGIETELKKLDIIDGIAKRKFIDPSSSIKLEIESLGDPKKTYEKLFDAFFSYLRQDCFINYIFAFICHNIETKVTTTTSETSTITSRDEAMAFLDAKELIIPNNAIGKTMTLAHEIAHNFGVQHTFDVLETPTQKGDIKLTQKKTLENIMDYPKNGDDDRKNLIKYQWEKMREKMMAGVNTISELSIEKHPNSDLKRLIDYRYSKNLSFVSQYLLKYLIEAYEKKYDLNDVSLLLDYRDRILDIFSEKIISTLNKI